MLSVVMLNVIMLNVIMLSVVMLSVIMECRDALFMPDFKAIKKLHCY